MPLGSENLIQRIFEATLLNKAEELESALHRLRHQFPSVIHHHLHGFGLPPSRLHSQLPSTYDAAAPELSERLRSESSRSLCCPYVRVGYLIASDEARSLANRAFQRLHQPGEDPVPSRKPAPELSHVPSPEPSSEPSPEPFPTRELEMPLAYQSTPLHLGAALGHRHVVKVLLDQGSIRHCLNLRDSLDYTPLGAAVVSQEVSVVRMVLKKTMSLSRQVRKVVFNKALQVAVALGGVDVVAELFKDVRFRRLVTWSPSELLQPVSKCQLDMVRLLVRMAGKVPCGTSGFAISSFPLHYAVYHLRSHTQEELELVQCLLKHGANPNQICHLDSSSNLTGTALHMALITHEENFRLMGPVPSIVHALLHHHADPNARSSSGEPPLFWMTPGYCVQSLRLLLQYGANPLVKNYRGDTYLTSPTFLNTDFQQREIKFTQVLLSQARQLLSADDKHGLSVLHRAVTKPRLFWFLLCSGADPSLEDHSGCSVLEHILASQTTVSGLAFRCLTLLMCVKGGVAFPRPRGIRKSMLSYMYPAGPSHKVLNMKGQDLQLMMIQMLFEMGYLTSNDRMQYFLQAVSTDWPSRILPSVNDLTRSPPSLISICRRSFITSLPACPRHRDEAIANMTYVPNWIKKYLQFSDLVGDVANVLGWCEDEIWSYFS